GPCRGRCDAWRRSGAHAAVSPQRRARRVIRCFRRGGGRAADHLVVALSLFWNAAGAVRTAGGPGRSAGFRRGRADRELMTTAAVVVPTPAWFAGAPRAVAQSRRIVRRPRPGRWGPPSR